jgi:hypothetical protein
VPTSLTVDPWCIQFRHIGTALWRRPCPADAVAFGPHDEGSTSLPVLMIAEVPNLTEQIYAALIPELTPLMRTAEGFISHAGGPRPRGGWRIVETWESETDGKKWYAERVKPNLPPGVGIIQDRRYYPLHTAFTK